MIMKSEENVNPTIFTIFGGAGDLTWRKLVPALFSISHYRSMPSHLSIIAVDRVDMTDNQLRKRLRDGVTKFSNHGVVDDAEWEQFARHIHYMKGDFKSIETYNNLKLQLRELEKEWEGGVDKVYYMATPPAMFGEIPKYLGESELANEKHRSRIVVEKPIGYDLDSARQLNKIFTDSFRESQIFRIDHYLGKETVQNILAFRFANPLFEPLWNRGYVDYITITVAEALGIGHRGEYYDKSGALRDMIQNHLMQLLCLVAMEPMVSFDADEIRNKKADVLHSVRPISHDDVGKYVVRGQYGSGQVCGQDVVGYHKEMGVSPDSQTETFVAMRLFVDNWRWQDVPFYLRTGKRLPQATSEIVIHFRSVPHRSFPKESSINWQSAGLKISINPSEEITLRFQAKEPGPKVLLRPVDMKFNYRESFKGPHPEAYETLLWDLIVNDATQFMRSDQVEAAWRILTPILEVWENNKPEIFPNYTAGTWGPEAADRLIAQHGHRWMLPGLR